MLMTHILIQVNYDSLIQISILKLAYLKLGLQFSVSAALLILNRYSYIHYIEVKGHL